MVKRKVQKRISNWYNRVAPAVLIILLVLLFNIFGLHTVDARVPPKRLNKRKELVMLKALQHLKHKHPNADHVELLAMAGWESEFSPKAKSKGNYGLVQINCTVWKKSLGLNSCAELQDMNTNIDAALIVLGRFRKKYRDCRGDYAYACYNKGQRWRVNRQKCLKRTSMRGACDGPLRYITGVKGYERMLLRNYRSLLVR